KPFSVTEGYGVARTNSPIDGGIAFKKGELTDINQLSLFRGSTEIPAQFTSLVRNKDNSIQWVLTTFTDNFTSGETKNYTLKTQAAAAQAPVKITMSRSGSVITFTNGDMVYSIDTMNFRGIHSLSYKGKDIISGNGGLSMLDLPHGTASVNGTVTKASFLYKGDLRVSLRIEGIFFKDSAGGVGYAYTVTSYAGSPQLYVTATIRNSINPDVGRAARIRYAKADFALAYDPSATIAFDTVLVRAYTSPALDTLRTSKAFDNPSGGGLIVTERFAGGNYCPNINRSLLNGRNLEVDIIRKYNTQTAYPLFYTDSIYVMRDLTHKTSEIMLQCYDGTMNTASLKTAVRGLKGKLRLWQDPHDLSEADALSAGKFGTVDDEITAYTKWGWTVPSDVKSQQVPVPQTDVAARLTLNIHGDTETDPTRNFLLQWVRTGKQGIFDIADCWAKHYRDLVTWRTTGFFQDGQYQVGTFIWQAKAKRLPKAGPAAGDQVWTYDVADYNTYGGCHTAMEGVADYYCLTGDVDALEALEDYGEMEHARTMAGTNDTTVNSNASFSDRATGRKFAFLLRLYEITKAPIWENLIKLKAKTMIMSKQKHPLGYSVTQYNTPEPQHSYLFDRVRLPDSLENYINSKRIYFYQDKYNNTFGIDSNSMKTWPIMITARWEGAYIAQAFSRYADIFNDENAKDMLIGYANYIKFIQTANCRFATSYSNWLNVPEVGKSVVYNDAVQWNSLHDKCYNATGTTAGVLENSVHAPIKTVLYPSIYALAYSVTGFKYFIDEAAIAWLRASTANGNRFLRNDKTIHSYAFCGSYYGSLFNPQFAYNEYKDDWVFQVCHAFREAAQKIDTIPPEKINNLAVVRSANGIMLSWTAPAGAKEYQVKYFKGKKIQEYPQFEYNFDKFYASSDTNRTSWWYATNVPGEPVPAAAGTPQGMTIEGTFPTTDTFYVVICSRDSAGNLSQISNAAILDGSIAVEKGSLEHNEVSISAIPNPFNPAVTLTAFVPSSMKNGQQVAIS
ncbi:MAG: hypothetical protein JNL74_12540, partial [Fibrobacteres bacterium]|nr:hypothetical protein [Fibrobacterota bacterium]